MTTAAGQALGDTHDARAATTPRVRRRAARHHWIVRVTHWVNVVALGLMVTTGLRIFNAYPPSRAAVNRSAAIRLPESRSRRA